MTLCFAAVMDGSVYGDQCSPISDTTVLSFRLHRLRPDGSRQDADSAGIDGGGARSHLLDRRLVPHGLTYGLSSPGVRVHPLRGSSATSGPGMAISEEPSIRARHGWQARLSSQGMDAHTRRTTTKP